MICLPAEFLGAATVALVLVGIIIGILLTGATKR